jgi:hypothetical protein
MKQCFTRHIVGDSVHAGQNDAFEHQYILIMPRNLTSCSLSGYTLNVAALTSNFDNGIPIRYGHELDHMEDTRSSCKSLSDCLTKLQHLNKPAGVRIYVPYTSQKFLPAWGFDIVHSLPFTVGRFVLAQVLNIPRRFRPATKLRDSTNHETNSGRFGGVVNAMPCYLSCEDIERHFLREQEFESLRRRLFCSFGACQTCRICSFGPKTVHNDIDVILANFGTEKMAWRSVQEESAYKIKSAPTRV